MQNGRQRLAARIALGLLLGASTSANAALLPPKFRFSPKAVGPGGLVTVVGERFVGPNAVILAVDTQGRPAVLGVATVDPSGGFSKTMPAPSVPGPYFMVVGDANQQLAINLIGTLSVLPGSTPWFGYAPSGVSPGGSVSATGGGFNPSATGVAFGIVDAAGAPTVLGTAPLSGGSFLKTFPVPSSMPAGSYGAFVVSSLPQMGVNLTGPMTLAPGPPAPTIDIGSYPIGAVADEAANQIWVPAAGDNRVWLLDGQTDTALTSVEVGGLPCAIAFHPRARRVYVANVNTSDVSVVDTATRSLVATVPVGAHPCAAAALPALDRVYIGNYASDTISVLEGATSSVAATIKVGRGPFGLAANPVTGRVYVVNGYDNTLSAIDGATNLVLATVAVGRDPDAVAVDPVTNRIFVANYLSASVTVVDGDTHAVVATVPVGREPAAVAVNSLTGRVYVANYSSNTVSVLDASTSAVVATLPVGLTPDGVAVNSATGRIYVVNSNSNDVSVIQ